MNKTENWQEPFLDGLTGEFKEKVKNLYEKIDFDIIEDAEAKRVIVPVLRCIASKILSPSEEQRIGCLKTSNWRGIVAENLFNDINVEDISKQLDICFKEFMPTANKYLPFLDAQAEITFLFCENYVFGLVESYLKNKTVFEM